MSLTKCLPTDSPFRKMKNACYFTLKVIFVVKYLNICPNVLGHAGKRLQKKARLIPKFMRSSTGKQVTAIHILPNTSRKTEI